MDAAFAAHPALLHGAVIDVWPGGFVDRLVGFGAQEEPGTSMAGPVGTLGPPVMFKFLEQAPTQGQDPFLAFIKSF